MLRNVKFIDDNCARVVKLLLNHVKLNINQTDQTGRSALHHACCESAPGAQLLVKDDRCDVNIKDVNGNTALMMVALSTQSLNDKHGKILQLLMKIPAIF